MLLEKKRFEVVEMVFVSENYSQATDGGQLQELQNANDYWIRVNRQPRGDDGSAGWGLSVGDTGSSSVGWA
jgi:hypothetical protein